MSILSRPPRSIPQGSRHSSLAVIPFVLLFAANEATVKTKVWPDGSARRDLRVVSDQHAKSAVRGSVGEIEGPWDWSRESETASAVEFRRSAMPGTAGEMPGVKLRVSHEFGGPSLLRTRYQYNDTVELREFNPADPKHAAAAEKMVLTYELALPGMVDDASLSPGGRADGNRVTWDLKATEANKGTHALQAASTRPNWGFLTFVVYVVIAYGACGLKPLLRRLLRPKPRKI